MNIKANISDPVVKDILEAALAEFANYGLPGARVEAIVARTQTSKRMIYYHFGSKEGLYVATLGYAYRKVGVGEIEQQLEVLPPLEALGLNAETAFERFCATPDFIRLTMQENLQGAKFLESWPALKAMNQARLAVVERIVERGKADGSIRDDVTPLDVYINFVGLCVYHISAAQSYRVLFDVDARDAEVQQRRKASIREAIVRYVRA